MCDPPPIGTQVEVQGLKARADLNGKRGWVTAYDEDADRVEVSLDAPGREKFKLKPANAVPVAKLQSAIDGLAVGACVEIAGLQSRADLNGRRGSVVSRDDAAGRIEVELDGLASKERIKVKPSNAKIAKDGLAVGAQVEIVGLQSRPDLNGRHGVIVAREVAVDLHGNDRLELHLDGPNGGERVKCKPANAKLVSAKLDLGVAVEMAAAAARLKAQHLHKDAGPDQHADNRACRDQGPDQAAAQGDRARARSDDLRAHGGPQRPPPSRGGEARGDGDPDGGRDHDRSRDRDRDRAGDRDKERDRKSERSRSRTKSGSGPALSTASSVTEDRSRDWVCKCGQRNFMRRSECFKCSAPRSTDAPLYTGVSHATEKKFLQQPQLGPPRLGRRLGEWTTAKELLGKGDWDALRRRVDARPARRQGARRSKERRPSTSSSSSSSSGSPSRKRGKRKSGSRSSSASSRGNSGQVASSATRDSPELEKLKNDALERLMKIMEEPLAVRKRSWRALLLEFHPDKHPEDQENSTAVFQFLQKGKALLDLKGEAEQPQ